MTQLAIDFTRITHPNSREAHDAIKSVKSDRHQKILGVVDTLQRPLTDRQIASALGVMEMNYVRPRITELIAAGALKEYDSVRCPLTGKTVRTVARPRD